MSLSCSYLVLLSYCSLCFHKILCLHCPTHRLNSHSRNQSFTPPAYCSMTIQTKNARRRGRFFYMQVWHQQKQKVTIAKQVTSQKYLWKINATSSMSPNKASMKKNVIKIIDYYQKMKRNHFVISHFLKMLWKMAADEYLILSFFDIFNYDKNKITQYAKFGKYLDVFFMSVP